LVRYVRGQTIQTPLYAFASIGQTVLATLVSAWSVQMILGTPAVSEPIYAQSIQALAVFALFYFVANALLTSLAVFARAGFHEVWTQLWPGSTLWSAISVVANIPFAIVLLLLISTIRPIYATLFVFVILAGIALILRLNVDLRKGNDELKTINRIGSLISATLEPEEIFRIIARESRRILHADGFFIALNENETAQVQITFLSGTGDEIAQRTIPRGAGLTGKAIQTGEVVLYSRGEAESGIDPEDTLRGHRRPRSIVVAPMKFGDDMIGALSVQSYQTDVYGGSQLRLLQTIAGQAAIAIRNAQLFKSEERAKHERDEFLSLVTHEIKNPLTSIRGYADLAEASANKDDPKGTVESLHVIRTEAKRILRLTDDLLDASRMTAGRFKVERKDDVDLGKIVTDAAGRYAATTGRIIEVDVAKNVPRVRGDALRLGQVVDNLLSNAVKYSAPETKIDAHLRADPQRVYLAVRDRGPGISAAKMPYVFDRFFRVEEGGQVVKGTGLGLFITREIVRMHGGTVDAQSTVGEGSTFTVVLPVA
ncbi:MAG TPA: GAF domain-containing sensor histidine kinase, partial [Thermoanaerobaculia bacterium]